MNNPITSSVNQSSATMTDATTNTAIITHGSTCGGYTPQGSLGSARTTKVTLAAVLMAISLWGTYSPYVAAKESYKFDETVVVTKNRRGILRAILEGGEWVIKTATGAVIPGIGRAVVNHTIEQYRQQQLVGKIHQEQLNHYSYYHQPIPATRENIALMMQRIAANQSERAFVVDIMLLYERGYGQAE